jgi:hypothetical protein
VTKIAACVLSMALGLAVFTSPVALANTSSAQGATQTNPKKARKAYLKHQKHEQKKERKAQKKAEKKWKKQHQAGD